MTKEAFTIKDVRNFFKSAPLELAEIAMELATEELADRANKKAAFSKRMQKARAGRGKSKVATEVGQTVAGAAEPQSELPAQVAAPRRRGRPASAIAAEPAPHQTHQTEATSVSEELAATV